MVTCLGQQKAAEVMSSTWEPKSLSWKPQPPGEQILASLLDEESHVMQPLSSHDS